MRFLRNILAILFLSYGVNIAETADMRAGKISELGIATKKCSVATDSTSSIKCSVAPATATLTKMQRRSRSRYIRKIVATLPLPLH